MTATTTEQTAKKSADKAVPAHLVREVIDGIPVYYKGYRSVRIPMPDGENGRL